VNNYFICPPPVVDPPTALQQESSKAGGTFISIKANKDECIVITLGLDPSTVALANIQPASSSVTLFAKDNATNIIVQVPIGVTVIKLPFGIKRVNFRNSRDLLVSMWRMSERDSAGER
jgi:hypothetical protein